MVSFGAGQKVGRGIFYVFANLCLLRLAIFIYFPSVLCIIRMLAFLTFFGAGVIVFFLLISFS